MPVWLNLKELGDYQETLPVREVPVCLVVCGLASDMEKWAFNQSDSGNQTVLSKKIDVIWLTFSWDHFVWLAHWKQTTGFEVEGDAPMRRLCNIRGERWWWSWPGRYQQRWWKVIRIQSVLKVESLGMEEVWDMKEASRWVPRFGLSDWNDGLEIYSDGAEEGFFLKKSNNLFCKC